MLRESPKTSEIRSWRSRLFSDFSGLFWTLLEEGLVAASTDKYSGFLRTLWYRPPESPRPPPDRPRRVSDFEKPARKTLPSRALPSRGCEFRHLVPSRPFREFSSKGISKIFILNCPKVLNSGGVRVFDQICEYPSIKVNPLGTPCFSFSRSEMRS